MVVAREPDPVIDSTRQTVRGPVIAAVGGIGLTCAAAGALLAVYSEPSVPGGSGRAPYLLGLAFGVVGLLTRLASVLPRHARPAIRLGAVLTGLLALALLLVSLVPGPHRLSPVVPLLVAVPVLIALCATYASAGERVSPRDDDRPPSSWVVAIPLGLLALAVAALGTDAFAGRAVEPLWVAIVSGQVVIGLAGFSLVSVRAPAGATLAGFSVFAAACLPAALAAALLARVQEFAVGRTETSAVLLLVLAAVCGWLAGHRLRTPVAEPA